MILRRFFLFLLSILFLTANVFPQNKAKEPIKDLVGRWSTIVNKEVKSKTMITFHSNGTMEYDIAAIIKGDYFLSKNLMTTYFHDSKKNTTEIDTSIIRIEGDTLYQTNLHQGKKILIKSVKLGKETLGGGLMGKWLSQNFNGHKAIQEFGNNHQLMVDLIVRSINGTYTVSGNTLTFNLERSPIIKFTFKIKKGVMTIIQPGQKGEKKLIKVDNY